MHIPNYFAVTDRELIRQFIMENSFATIVSPGEGYPVATHIPLELEVNEAGEEVLWGHVSRANPQWRLLETQPGVLAIFQSPVHHYISSSWYGHPNAPTWNYMSVHVSGRATLITGDKLWEAVRRLTNRYEQIAEHPVSLDTLPPSVQKQMNGLVGFELSIDKVEAAFKLSQNRNAEDYENIIRELQALGTAAAGLMAAVMRQQRAT
jgi:transcriptional regulator